MTARFIVHVTDFHIENPDASPPVEYLRRNYFDEYLKSLLDELRVAISESLGRPVSQEAIVGDFAEISIVATGDFVHKGAVEHFAHAETVLQELARGLGVPKQRILVCPGNHDIDSKTLAAARPGDARKAFDSFARGFYAGVDDDSILERGEKANLYRMSEGLFALILDSNFGAEETDKAGILTHAEADVIMSRIKARVDPNDVLLVAAHHPVDFHSAEKSIHDLVVEHHSEAPSAPAGKKKTKSKKVAANPLSAWQQHHMWIDGARLRHRLVNYRDHAPTIWFGGDIHRSLRTRNGPNYCFITGRLGTRIGTVANVHREVALIGIGSDHQVSSQLFSFFREGNLEEPVGGGWVRSKYEPGAADSWSKWRRNSATGGDALITTISAESAPGNIASAPINAAADKIIEIIDDGASFPPKNIEREVVTIDADFDLRLRAAIARRQLYRLGRFATSDAETSLSWVSIGPLLNDLTLLSDMLDHMTDWLHREMVERRAGRAETCIIGLDCWGAIIASQLGVLVECPSLAYASRGRGAHSSQNERVNDVLRRVLVDKQLIVLVSDVVSSGESFVRLRDELTTSLPEGAAPDWVALSVICDASRSRGDRLAFLGAFGTACGSLPMPVLPSHELPDESTLRTVVSVR